MTAAGRIAFPSVVLGGLQLLRQKKAAVLISILSFSMLCAVAVAFVERKIDAIEESLSKASGLTREELQVEINDQVIKLSSMDPVVLLSSPEFSYQASEIPETEKVEKDQVGILYVSKAGVLILGLFAFNMIVAFVALIFFLLLFSTGSSTAYEAAAKLPGHLWSSFWLFFWMLFRSFLWIPFFGIPVAFYMLPRLSLAPVILLTRDIGVMGSTKESMRRTKGRWLQLLLTWVGVLLVALLLLWFFLVIVSILALFSAKVALFLWICTLIAIIAYIAACTVMLTAMLV